MVNEFHVDAIPIGSIPCGSVITALFYWQGKLFVGYADRTVKVSHFFSSILLLWASHHCLALVAHIWNWCYDIFLKYVRPELLSFRDFPSYGGLASVIWELYLWVKNREFFITWYSYRSLKRPTSVCRYFHLG